MAIVWCTGCPVGKGVAVLPWSAVLLKILLVIMLRCRSRKPWVRLVIFGETQTPNSAFMFSVDFAVENPVPHLKKDFARE